MPRKVIRHSVSVGTVAWTPASLPNIAAWYKADDAGSITESSGSVSQWNDLSGNARHLTQGTGSAQPTTASRTIGGVNGLAFDGGDSLNNTSFAFPSVNTATLYVVVLVDSAVNDRIISLSNSSGDDYNGADRIAFLSTDGSTHYCYGNNGTRASAARVVGSSVQLTIQRNGDAFSMWKDGSSATGGSGYGTSNFSGGLFSVGAYIASGSSFNPQYSGVVGEVVFTSGVDGTTDRQTTEAYLKAKWGTP